MLNFKEFSHYDKRVWPLMFGWFINALGFGAVVPFMTVYFHTVRDVPMTYISFFFLAAAIFRAVSQGIGGALSDRIGRKGLMMWSQLSRSVIFLAAGYAVSVNANVWLIAAIIICQYLFSSFYQPVASAMLADVMPSNNRSQGYAMLRMAGNIGWGTGPAIGGFLFDISYQSLFLFTSVTFLLSGLFVLIFIKETVVVDKLGASSETLPQKNRFADMLAALKEDRIFLFFCITALFLFLTWGQFISTLSVYMTKSIGLSSRQIGWIYAYNAALVIVFQLLLTRAVKKVNHFLLMFFGALLFSVSYAVMGWVDSYLLMFIVITFVTFGEMFAGPSGNTITSLVAKPGQFGRYQGVYSLVSTLGWSLGPFIGGIFMDLIPNMTIFWMVMASFGFVSLFGFMRLYLLTKDSGRF